MPETVRILVIGAQDIARMDVNATDAIVKVTFCGQERQTKECPNNMEPVWNEELIWEVDSLGDEVKFEMVDKDIMVDDFMGSAVVPFRNLVGAETEISLPPKGGRLRIRVDIDSTQEAVAPDEGVAREEAPSDRPEKVIIGAEQSDGTARQSSVVSGRRGNRAMVAVPRPYSLHPKFAESPYLLPVPMCVPQGDKGLGSECPVSAGGSGAAGPEHLPGSAVPLKGRRYVTPVRPVDYRARSAFWLSRELAARTTRQKRRFEAMRDSPYHEQLLETRERALEAVREHTREREEQEQEQARNYLRDRRAAKRHVGDDDVRYDDLMFHRRFTALRLVPTAARANLGRP